MERRLFDSTGDQGSAKAKHCHILALFCPPPSPALFIANSMGIERCTRKSVLTANERTSLSFVLSVACEELKHPNRLLRTIDRSGLVLGISEELSFLFSPHSNSGISKTNGSKLASAECLRTSDGFVGTHLVLM